VVRRRGHGSDHHGDELRDGSDGHVGRGGRDECGGGECQQITATTPAHAAGAVNVVVTNPDTQSGTLTNGTPIPAVWQSLLRKWRRRRRVSSASDGDLSGGTDDRKLNVVVVGWNDTTSTVQSVTDSTGNAYSLAIGPTSGTGLRQSIYYAANINGGSNTVKVTFSQTATYRTYGFWNTRV